MQPELQPLIHELEVLHAEMMNLAQENLAVLCKIHPENQSGAANLLHYVALRRHDIRALQDQLTKLGLSSLGRTESNVLGSVRAVMTILSSLRHGEPVRLQDFRLPEDEPGDERCAGLDLLERNTERLLGPEPEGRNVRIMVTMPSEAATNYELVRDLVVNGMNCMRINCAHDGEEAWSGMIRNLRRAELETGKRCKIEMDLAGPKLRTGPIEPGPAVMKIRPTRDALGRLKKPARVWLTPRAHPEEPPCFADACILASGRWLATLKTGDGVHFTDTRGARRSMTITEAAGNSRWAEAHRTAYIAPGVILTAMYQINEKQVCAPQPRAGRAHSIETPNPLTAARRYSDSDPVA